MNKKFSIIIPVYNEKKNIEKLSKKIIRSLRNVKYEIIFVDVHSKQMEIYTGEENHARRC